MAQQRLDGLLQEVLRCDVAGADAEVRWCHCPRPCRRCAAPDHCARLSGHHLRGTCGAPGPPSRATQAARGAGGPQPGRGRCQPGVPAAPGRHARWRASTHRGAHSRSACARMPSVADAAAQRRGREVETTDSSRFRALSALPSGPRTVFALQPAPGCSDGQPGHSWQPWEGWREGGTRRWWARCRLAQRGGQQCRQTPAGEPPAACAVVRPPHGVPSGLTHAGAVAWWWQWGCLWAGLPAAQRVGSTHAGAGACGAR